MNIKRVYTTFLSLVILSMFEGIGFLFYIIRYRLILSGISPSSILLLGLGLGVVILMILLLTKIRQSDLSMLASKKKYGNHLDVPLLVIVNSIIISIILLVKPKNINDFVGEVIFVRLLQYFPAILLFTILSIQFLFLFTSASRPFQDKFYKNIFTGNNQWMVTELLIMTSLLLYFVTSRYLWQLSTPNIAYFPQLADSFLNGRFYLIDPPSTKDLSLFAGKIYVSFPPLAAILMMPIVSIAGVNGINTTLWNNMVAALGVGGIYLALEQLRILNWTRLGRKDNILLSLALGFGTVQYFMAIRGPVYYISQLLAATIISFSLWIGLINVNNSKNKGVLFHALLTGTVFSVALLARPNVGFVIIGLIAIQYQKLLDSNAFSYKKILLWVVAFSLPIIIVVMGLGWYNQVRFGSPFDFGYRYMRVVDPVLINDLKVYGQFHPHFIFRNIYDNFFRLPVWDSVCRLITPDPRGMSIFLVSPIVLFLFKAKTRKAWAIGLWISTGIILFIHLLYFNSGAFQFGYRFSLDFMPLVVLLLATAFKDHLNRFALMLLASGFIVNFIGVLWVTRVWCVNW